MSKCPKNVHLFWKMSINKNFKVIIYRAKNIKTQILTYTLYLTRLQMSPNDIQLHPRSSSIRLSLDRTFMIWNLFLKIAISKFLEIANFFLKGTSKFLIPDLNSTLKSSSINWGQIPKNVNLSSSYSPKQTQEAIFEVTFPAGVNQKRPQNIERLIFTNLSVSFTNRVRSPVLCGLKDQ